MTAMREVVLVVTACLSNGSSCEEYRVPAYEVASEMACTTSSLPMVSQWAAQHPDLVVHFWRCEARKKEQ